MKLWLILTLGVLALGFLGFARAEKSTVREGQPAPDFTLQDQDGHDVTLSALRGKWVVLYFYPKDDTPGCTKEACAFRDFIEQYRALGAEVLGVSVDDVSSHKKFHQKYKLNFRLLADPDKRVTRMYGVLHPLGWARRVTFVIDPQGVVRKVFPKVDVGVHSQEILDFLKAASTGRTP
ncbi:MAG: peroxiredoxin [Acidobacteria bacterium]|nr:peroxiredoxin [Acidobacteriota bacterium]MDW7984932.1 peroxiredoxin [Acidobacteriota bacterium]